MQIPPDFPTSPVPRDATGNSDRIEAMFLQEILKTSGIETSGAAAEGGIGAEQFSSFLTEEYARLLAVRIDLRLTGTGGK